MTDGASSHTVPTAQGRPAIMCRTVPSATGHDHSDRTEDCRAVHQEAAAMIKNLMHRFDKISLRTLCAGKISSHNLAQIAKAWVQWGYVTLCSSNMEAPSSSLIYSMHTRAYSRKKKH